MRVPYVSVIVPVYGREELLDRALRSVIGPWKRYGEGELEIIVVDDGSPQAELIERICMRRKGITLLRHRKRFGMVRARNSGIRASSGEIVTILDADDEFVSEWPRALKRVVEAWAPEVNVVFTKCVDTRGRQTCSDPTYEGPLTAEDLARERYAGEYNPLFRGDYIRDRGYLDAGTNKSCGLLTYLALAKEHPFWISRQVLRCYHTEEYGSTTSRWLSPQGVREGRECLRRILEEHGEYLRSNAPDAWSRLRQKERLYSYLSDEQVTVLDILRLAQPGAIAQAFAIAVAMTLGKRAVSKVWRTAKRLGVLKRFG